MPISDLQPVLDALNNEQPKEKPLRERMSPAYRARLEESRVAASKIIVRLGPHMRIDLVHGTPMFVATRSLKLYNSGRYIASAELDSTRPVLLCSQNGAYLPVRIAALRDTLPLDARHLDALIPHMKELGLHLAIDVPDKAFVDRVEQARRLADLVVVKQQDAVIVPGKPSEEDDE